MSELDSQLRIPSSSMELLGLWETLLSSVQKTRKLKLADILYDFFESPEDPADYPMTGLHHVAFYLGDYCEEAEVDRWHQFLMDAKEKGRLASVDRGPSYISPKYYGTPGWWFSVKGCDGFVMEMFSCRHYGLWMKLPPEIRQSLMSHKAISILSETQVLPTLKRLDKKKNIELIAFTRDDALGHTYGHLRNNDNHKVLELVYGQ